MEMMALCIWFLLYIVIVTQAIHLCFKSEPLFSEAVVPKS